MMDNAVLADLAFGVKEEEEKNDNRVLCQPFVSYAFGSMGHIQLLLVVSITCSLVVAWSIQKALTYRDLLQGDIRARCVLFLFNAIIISVGCWVILKSHSMHTV